MYSALLNETAVESLEETYALFTRICRDTATLQDMEQAYESKITAIRKFGPGKELLDLEMEDRNGTKVNLSSLKGKVRYVDVWASWCGPCKMLSPVIESLADQYEGKVLVGKVNVDEEPDLARRFGVMSIPTVVFLKNGQEFDRKVGVMPPQAFSGVLDTNL